MSYIVNFQQHSRLSCAQKRVSLKVNQLPARSTNIAQAGEIVNQITQLAEVPSIALGVGAVGAVGALVLLTDPQKRRDTQASTTGGDEMESVKNYFNQEGFDRWNRIYSERDDVNKVQLDIRTGHAQTVEKTVGWLTEKDLKGTTICDAGCGTGSLTIPLAMAGAQVSASDISKAMVTETESRFNQEASKIEPTPPTPQFTVAGLEDIQGSYDTVCCLDVFIHYPQDKADGMISHLAGLAKNKLVVSFAPKTLYYSALKRVGELFPGPSKATRAYLHAEADVEAALEKAGFKVTRREMTATSFYFSRLLEAERV